MPLFQSKSQCVWKMSWQATPATCYPRSSLKSGRSLLPAYQSQFVYTHIYVCGFQGLANGPYAMHACFSRISSRSTGLLLLSQVCPPACVVEACTMRLCSTLACALLVLWWYFKISSWLVAQHDQKGCLWCCHQLTSSERLVRCSWLWNHCGRHMRCLRGGPTTKPCC